MRPVPKVGDVVEVDSNPDPDLNAPHPSDWVPMIVTRMNGRNIHSVKALPGTRYGLLSLVAGQRKAETDAWWRWPRWHLSTVLRAMAADTSLSARRRQHISYIVDAITVSPKPTFAEAFETIPFGLAWASRVPFGTGRRRSLPREVHDALVFYAEAHGIERDAPATASTTA